MQLLKISVRILVANVLPDIQTYLCITYTYAPIHTFIIPFQLSPVAILNRVRKAAPEFSKLACTPMPSHGFLEEHSENINQR